MEKITVTKIQEYFGVDLTSMDENQFSDTIMASVSAIDTFLGSARKLGYIKEEEAIEKASKLRQDFSPIQSYISQILKSK